ncbi:fungal specific transcription factor domain-containing protein [Verticillium dahliae VdLs.17]|uniref:Fungal specific transcription factor domain-containing protein n=1 Tax=Verticillium dahliae (strain VdLs.17 / ATCC MYA-4575 / FGSC 10137) TaxID=498257 RepID=G2WVL3_VERDV|nr:fungal specific transcription factor domain-containing protein [Verticillium dahliae VdLs.17]EGY19633.1 fungal specific transcription factor domain-containing protein [Verticillium dahliae VdLs.17]KAH6705924.1 fungal-specific transcription factor domain-containing protein [Verticillium dahliae]
MDVDPSTGPEDPNLRRAIRCDKGTPCSNCRTALRSCSSIGVTHKPREQRQRVLISHQYERKIDLIEERLSGIEDALRTIANSGLASEFNHLRRATTTTPSVPASAPKGDAQAFAHEEPDDDDDETEAFEGDLSLTAHTVFARDFLENAVQRTSLSDVTPNMQSALLTLRQMVSMQNESSSIRELKFPNQQPLPPGGLPELPMPPMAAVVSLLKHQKGLSAPSLHTLPAPPSIFAIACSFLDIDDLSELCRKVYFCTDTFSHPCFVIVVGSLYYLFMEQSFLAKDNASRADFQLYQRMCQVNLETALASLPLMLPAKAESIEALLVATLYSIDVSKTSLAWHFVSTAATLCQTLGYHRASRVKPEPHASGKDVKTLLFWHTYMLDKSLALRTGRSSAIQDWDITLPRTVDSTMVEDPWGAIITTWIRESEMHHRVYEHLYSPTALARPRHERVEAARRLEADQKDIMAAASQAREQAMFGFKALNASALIDIHLRGDELTHQSTLTLIYRAIPAPEGSPSRFTQECIETARFAMQIHHECMAQLDEAQHMKAVYVHWAILLTPFAPFFVLFCHVIETSSAEDLKRLYEFADSLGGASPISEPVQKLHRLCQVLYNVALTYVEAKAQQPAANQAPINEEFDMYLSALGFPPNELLAPGTGVEAGAAAHTAVQSEQLANWFSGNQQMMGLLEEDLSQFGPTGWIE